MSANQALSFQGGVIQTDTLNTPGALVTRDDQGNINVSTVNALGIDNAGGTVEGPSSTLSTTGNILQSATVQPLNAASGSFTATLPPVGPAIGMRLLCIKVDATVNIPQIKGSGSDQIVHNHAAANTYNALTGYGDAVYLWSNGTVWFAMEFAS